MARGGPLLILGSKGQRLKKVQAKIGKFEFVAARAGGGTSGFPVSVTLSFIIPAQHIAEGI